jgi:phage terminase Nu1 subunit (DNA packaging protein)
MSNHFFMNRFFHRRTAGWWLLALTILSLVIWIVTDLTIPRKHSIRQFDPNSVARIETSMWRSYYNKSRVTLFRQLAGGLRSQFNAPYWRSYGLAFQASRAAFVFKEGQSRAEYEEALPLLVDYYAAIQRLTQEKFDVQKVARLELEWWIIHRERNRYSYDDLAKALAQTAGALYGIPPDRFADYSQLRTQAMRQSDEAQKRGPKEADWQRIEQQLHWAWQSLYRVIVLDDLSKKQKV